MTTTMQPRTVTDVQDAVRALVPTLRERAQQTEDARRVPQETIDDLTITGLYDLMKPLRYGGIPASTREVNNIMATVAEGCGSTAWVTATGLTGAFWASTHSPEANDEVFANTSGPRANGILAARGVATPVDGGFELSGTWPFSTGCLHAEWANLGAVVKDQSGEVIDQVLVLVPMTDVRINDDWDVTSLRGSGSNSITVDKAVVPAHRSISMGRLLTGEYGCRANQEDQPVFGGAFVPLTSATSTGAAIGLARHAIDWYVEQAAKRGIAYTHWTRQVDSPVVQVHVAEASLKLETAQLLADAVADLVDARAAANEPFARIESARVRAQVAYAVRLCLEAAEIVFTCCGGSAIASSNPVQRIVRDLHAMNLHGVLALDTNTELYGRLIFGLDPLTPIL